MTPVGVFYIEGSPVGLLWLSMPLMDRWLPAANDW